MPRWDSAPPPQTQIAVPPFRGVTAMLVIACSVVWAALNVLPALGLGDVASLALHELGLTPQLVSEGHVWQLATYALVHLDIMHLLFNMLGLWMFGWELERLWGPRRYAGYVLVTAVGAGVCSWIVGVHSTGTIIGISGAVYAILLAYAILWPRRLLYVFGIIPMQARWFVLGFGALEFVMSVSQSQDGVAHVAHLGGMAVGFLYMLIPARWRRYQQSHMAPPTRAGKVMQFMGNPVSSERPHFTAGLPIERRRMNAQVDELLDKILTQGVDALTPEERAVLIRAGKYFASQGPGDRPN